MKKVLMFHLVILMVFALKTASADVFKKKGASFGGKTAAKSLDKAKGDTASQNENNKDMNDLVAPGMNEVPMDGGIGQGAFDGIVDDAMGGGMGSGLMGGTGMVVGGGQTGSGSGDNSGSSSGGSSSSGPDVNKLPTPSPEPQPYPNKGGGGMSTLKSNISGKNQQGQTSLGTFQQGQKVNIKDK